MSGFTRTASLPPSLPADVGAAQPLAAPVWPQTAGACDQLLIDPGPGYAHWTVDYVRHDELSGGQTLVPAGGDDPADSQPVRSVGRRPGHPVRAARRRHRVQHRAGESRRAAAVPMENPYCTRCELTRCSSVLQNISYEAWSPMKHCPFTDPTILKIGKAHSVSASQVCLQPRARR